MAASERRAAPGGAKRAPLLIHDAVGRGAARRLPSASGAFFLVSDA
jgi:hypothetical protein